MLSLFNRKHSLMEPDILSGSIDSHSHILFGVDDGVRTLEDSLKALDFEQSLGVRKVWCTPHIMEEVENTSDALKARFEELKSAYNGPLDLGLAAEYMLDSVFDERLAAKDLLVREDNMVMVETRAMMAPIGFEDTLAEAQLSGYTVLLAHPERYFYLEKEDYKRLYARGIRFQLNLPSLCMQYGKIPYEKACWLLEQGMYYAIGSDCHRSAKMAEQYSQKTISKSALTNLADLVSKIRVA